MKRLKVPVWANPVLYLLVFLFFSGYRISGPGIQSAALNAQQNPTAAADQAPDQPAANPQHTLTIVRTGNGQGKVTNSPAGSSFKKGTPVTLQAVPSSQSVFAGWSGSCSGSSPTCLVTMSADRKISASFSLKTYVIHVRHPVNGVIHPSGTVKVPHGEKRRFQIIPLPGYRVSEVLVDKVSVGPVTVYSFKEVTGEHLVEAIFVKQ
jgi:hypothetical protein